MSKSKLIIRKNSKDPGGRKLRFTKKTPKQIFLEKKAKEEKIRKLRGRGRTKLV